MVAPPQFLPTSWNETAHAVACGNGASSVEARGNAVNGI
jgi:hypothetical protein